jgi:predicted DNA-binding transcriptional regulator AlpA
MSTTEIPDAAVMLTIAQVCAISQLAPRTIRRWVSAGKFPAPRRLCAGQSKFAKGVRWVRSEVMAWVEKMQQSRGGVA